MAVEIERKFLVNAEKWEKIKPENGVRIVQGYLSNNPETSVRVRIKGEKGFLTIKGITEGISRLEYEYEIPKNDAEELLKNFCPKQIDKVRFEVRYKGLIWEVDEFTKPKKGLILAEVELSSEDEKVDLPSWITEEVTGQKEYYNSNML